MLKWKWLYPKRARDREKGSMNTADTVFPVLSGKRLLSAPHRQAVIAEIKHYSGLPEDKWGPFYGEMLERFAAFVQELPASEYHHHARRGGLLDHSLEVCLNAMKLCQAELNPSQGQENTIAAERYAYAVCAAALLHDAGKILSDVHPVIVQGSGEQAWFPWMGVIRRSQYRVRFNTGRSYAAHGELGLLLAPLVVPASGLNWIGATPAFLTAWASAVIDRKEAAGNMGRIIQEADRLSVKRELRASQSTGSSRPPSVADRFVTALKTLISDGQLLLNCPGAAGWLTDSTLWLVAKTSADMVRSYWAERGQTSIPSQNPRLFTLLQEAGVLIPNEKQAVWHCKVSDPTGWKQELRMIGVGVERLWADREQAPAVFAGAVEPVGQEAKAREGIEAPAPTKRSKPKKQKPQEGREIAKTIASALGRTFVDWLKEGIDSGTLSVNEPTAKIHTVDGGVFLVSPGIFRDFSAKHPTALDDNPEERGKEADEHWAVVQRAFQRLGLHRKAPNGQNIWTCKVKSAKGSKLRGFWLEDGDFWPAGRMPPDNPHLVM